MSEIEAATAKPAADSRRELRLALLLVFLIASLRIAWLCDDAFISFRTVDNFVHGYGLTWNTDERVQSFTHPLWLFVVSAAYALTHEILITPLLLSLACAGAAVAVVLFRLCTDLPRAVSFVLLMLVSQALLDFSSSGLENALSYLLVALFVVEWLRGQPARIGRLFLLGGLLALNRQDLALLVAPALAGALWIQRSPGALRSALIGLAPLLGWELFSLIYYGFPFPNTYYAKLETGIPERAYLEQGFIYLEDLLVHDPATALILALAPLAAWRSARALILGLLLYCSYVIWVGGDFMQGRFFSVPAFLGAVLLVRHPRDAATMLPMPVFAGLALLAAAANALVVTGYGDGLGDFAQTLRTNGVADERRFYLGFGHSLSRLTRGGRFFLDVPWAHEAMAWREQGGVHVVRAAGIVGFVAGPRAHLIDSWALTDPLLARLPVTGDWRIGHFERRLPFGFIESIESGENRIADPGIARLHDALDRVTGGPLWSWPRFQAIVELNTGRWRAWLTPAAGLVRISADRLADAKPDHAPWDCAGCLVLTASGAEIDFAALRHERRLSLSVDNNDRYRLRFLDGTQLRDEQTLEPSNDGPGLKTHRIELPEAAAAQGYDRVEVLPSGGDGRYSVGHLTPKS